MTDDKETISVLGARVHNLKNIECRDSTKQPYRDNGAERKREIVVGFRYDFCGRTAEVYRNFLGLRP